MEWGVSLLFDPFQYKCHTNIVSKNQIRTPPVITHTINSYWITFIPSQNYIVLGAGSIIIALKMGSGMQECKEVQITN